MTDLWSYEASTELDLFVYICVVTVVGIYVPVVSVLGIFRVMELCGRKQKRHFSMSPHVLQKVNKDDPPPPCW